MQDQFRPITSEDLIRKYNLGQLQVDRKRISVLDQQLTKTDGILTNFVEQTTKDIEDIQDQLDGNITSWFYNGVPTLNNAPAVDWTTTALKDDHLGDLYYDLDEGTAYRFILDNGVYQWNLLQDDAAAQALSIARAAQDTADHKRRVFVVQPTPPYDVGDVWWNTSNSEMYRCRVAKTEQDTFASTDWINDLKYTDDSTAIGLVNDLRADIVEGYATKTELTQSTDSINASVKALRVITDTQHQIFETTPTPPYNVGDYYIDKTNMEVYDCITAKAEGESYSSADWVLDMELTDYVTEAGVGIFEDAINMEVKRKVGDDEIITKLNLTPEAAEINSRFISLAGKQIKMTTDNISIASTNFNVDKNGNVTCNNLNATNATVSGYINATAGYIGGAEIVGNTLKIGNINIDTINGDKIQGGTINEYNNITIKNINANNITGGVIKSATINIGNGVFSVNSSGGAQLSTRYGFLSTRSANHPYVSALNVARGSGGVVFVNGNTQDSPGSAKAQIYEDNSVLYVKGDGGVIVQGVSFYNNYLHAGSKTGNDETREINIGQHYINAGKGGQIDVHADSGGHMVFYAASGKKVRCGGNAGSYNIATESSGPSSRNVKKNLKDISKDYKNVYEDLKNINMYTYDYKYDGIKENKSDYGFIIDEIEDTNTLSKYFRNYDEKIFLKDNQVVTQSYADEDMSKYNSLDIKEWERDSYIKGLFIVIKSLQCEIEELKDEVKSLKERNGAE